MPQDSRSGWRRKIQEKFGQCDEFLCHWNFRKEDGSVYYTIDPAEPSPEWNDPETPGNVFEVPEIWYGVERAVHPSFDNWAWHEVDFCRQLWSKYSEKPVETVLEVCSGICPHGSIMARDGLKVISVDSSAGMIKAAEERAKAQNLQLYPYKRDIFQFSIPGDPPDAAILLGNTFPLSRDRKTDNSALVSQLRSVGTFLKKGTIYIIDCGSPEPHPFESEYKVSQPWTVDIGFATVTLTNKTFPTDVETLATPFNVGYEVRYPAGRVYLKYSGAHSFVSAQHLAALVEMSQIFELEAFHHWGNMEPGLEKGGGPYLSVLRRK